MERVTYACRLRRAGVGVHVEIISAKKQSAFKRAVRLTRFGASVVYDLDDEADRKYLGRPDAFQEWRGLFPEGRPSWAH